MLLLIAVKSLLIGRYDYSAWPFSKNAKIIGGEYDYMSMYIPLPLFTDFGLL